MDSHASDGNELFANREVEMLDLMSSLFGHGYNAYGAPQPILPPSQPFPQDSISNDFQLNIDENAGGHSQPVNQLPLNGFLMPETEWQASQTMGQSTSSISPQCLQPANAANDEDEKSQTSTRAAKACGECRRAKVRCMMDIEGQVPCTRCKSTGKQCLFLNTIGRGKAPRKKKRKASESEATLEGCDINPAESYDNGEGFEGSAISPEEPVSPPRTISHSPNLSTRVPEERGGAPTSAFPTGESGTTSISRHDESQLFEIFYTSLNVRWGLLHKEVHTPLFCKTRSTFLYDTICFIATCYSIPHLHHRKVLSDTVRTQALAVPVISVPKLETVQAYLLLSLWGTGYGRRDDYDRAWTMICLASRMALDLQLYHPSWQGQAHRNAERTWILCCIIDRTKSSQRGRVPSINMRLEDSVRQARSWLADEPDCLLLVFYAELLHITHGALDLVTSLAKDNMEYAVIVKTHREQMASWLVRYHQLRDTFVQQSRIDAHAERYMTYLAEFYVAYWELVIASFELQYALDRQTPDLARCISSTSICAKRVLQTTERELSRHSPIRCAPDGHFEFILQAAVFLLKINDHISTFAQEIHALIDRVAVLMVSISRNKRDTPALYAALLTELSTAVNGRPSTSAADGNDFYSPAISAQTKQFAKILLTSKIWKSIVLPGINASNVESDS